MVTTGLRGEKYGFDALVSAMQGPQGSQGSGAPAAKRFEWTLGLGALADLVNLIPNGAGVGREEWIEVLHGVMGAGGPFEMFDAWSARWPGYDAGNTRKAWDGTVPSSVMSGGGLLRAKAEAANRAGFEAWLQRWEAAASFPDPVDDAAPVTEGGGEGGEGTGAVEALQRDVANLIVGKTGDRVRYNVSTGLWHVFDGTVWRENPHPIGYRLAKRWADQHAPSLGKAARKEVSKSAFYAGVEKILQAEEGIAVVKTDFDRDDWLLGTPGGTVDLRSGVLRVAAAADMISMSTSVAPAAAEDCPRWLAFIDWACTDPGSGKVDRGMVRTLKQWAGYCLTGDVAQEMVMFFHGGGANGKGTFIETMQRVMGSYFYLATKDLFMETKHGPHEEEIAVLAGRRMVAADEVPVSARWNESLLKAVSGGGMMTARHLYGRVFEFPIKFKVTISGNSKPRLQGTVNEAMERRLHMAAFRMTAKPKDPAVKKAVMAEAAGVLRWALNGLADMLGSPGGGLFIADSMEAATEEYFKENDAFRQWLDERTEPSPGNDAPAGKLFEDWMAWAGAQGGTRGLDTAKQFKAEMVKRGHIWQEKRLGSIYKDLTVKVF
jgi:putative DNA primase/helicase